MTSGHGDGRHGFALRLPPNLPEAQSDCLITARERRSGIVFGRVLRLAQGAAPAGGPRVEQAAGAVADLWQKLAAADPLARLPPASARLRAAFAALAARLAAGPGAAPPFLPRAPRLALPWHAAPALSLVLPVHDAAAALCRIAALAPALGPLRAELIAVDAALDPAAALLPARVHGLRYLRDPQASGLAGAVNLAAAHAAGEHLVVLGDCPAQPSAAALLALARCVAAQPVAALRRAGAPAARPAAALPARLGLAVCVARHRLAELGPLELALQHAAGLECADLACRAALLGMPVLAVAEPVAVPPVAAAPQHAAAATAAAAFRERWGPPVAALDRRH
jgi:hypothetical protein